MARPDGLFAAYRGESLADARDQIRGRESVQLGVSGRSRSSVVPELSNSRSLFEAERRRSRTPSDARRHDVLAVPGWVDRIECISMRFSNIIRWNDAFRDRCRCSMQGRTNDLEVRLVNGKPADIQKLKDLLKRINEAVDDFSSTPATSASDRGAYDDYPLHKVALWGDTEAAEILLDHGADIDGLGEDDETALHRAVVGRKPEMIRLLLSRGANADIKNRYGESAREDAMSTGNPDLIAAMTGATN
jgi:hypothetical protein